VYVSGVCFRCVFQVYVLGVGFNLFIQTLVFVKNTFSTQILCCNIGIYKVLFVSLSSHILHSPSPYVALFRPSTRCPRTFPLVFTHTHTHTYTPALNSLICTAGFPCSPPPQLHHPQSPSCLSFPITRSKSPFLCSLSVRHICGAASCYLLPACQIYCLT